MTNQEAIKKLKAAGYKAEERTRASAGKYVVIVTEPGTDRPGLLKSKIAPLLKGTFKPSGNFSRRGEVTVGSVKIVAKDATKVSLVGFDARLFTKGGEATTISYNGKEVKCFSFKSQKAIETSILSGMSGNKSLKGVDEIVSDFFKGGALDWSGVEPAVVQKLAVYLGEVLIGWAGLSKNPQKYIHGTNPFMNSQPIEFLVPDDPMFSGVDSFFRLKNGSLVGISSKSGAGRPGSFFSNIMPAAMKMEVHGKTMKQLVAIVKRKGFKPTDSKAIVYEWGVNTLLKLNMAQPTEIVDSLKAGKKTKDVFRVAGALTDAFKKYASDASAQERLKQLPMSITSSFNYILAKSLEDSQDDVQNALVAKDYYQANLDDAKFQKGELGFTLSKAGKSIVKLVFKQSVIKDPAARNGWVNYEIKRA